MRKSRLLVTVAISVIVLIASGLLVHFNTNRANDKKVDNVGGSINVDSGELTVIDTIQMNTQPPEIEGKKTSTNSSTQQTANQTTTPQANSSTPNTFQAPAVNTDCYKTVITHNIIYKDDPYRYVGEEWSPGPGQNGYVLHCPYGDFTVPAVDKIVKQGVKRRVTTDTGSSTAISYDVAFSNCLALGTGGTSAFELCMEAYGY